MGIASRQKRAWREFEELVTRIEQSSLPPGAVVRSPDQILDRISQELREVDASIRYQIGNNPILITLECRDRSRKGDQTWLEQMIAKKQDIGANLTIGVSTKGFSKGARLKAEMYGIRLREMREVDPENIKAAIFALHLSATLTRVRVTFDESISDTVEVRSLDGSSLAADVPYLLEQATGTTWTLDELVHHYFISSEAREEWATGERTLSLEFVPCSYYVRTNIGTMSVKVLELTLQCSVSMTPLELKNAQNYLEGEKQLAQVQRWVGAFPPSHAQANMDLHLEILTKPSTD